MQGADPSARLAISQADPEAADLEPAELDLLRFVETVTKHAHRVTDDDVQHLRSVGWSDPQIAECVYITALFAFFNRVADAFGLADSAYLDTPPLRG